MGEEEFKEGMFPVNVENQPAIFSVIMKNWEKLNIQSSCSLCSFHPFNLLYSSNIIDGTLNVKLFLKYITMSSASVMPLVISFFASDQRK